MLLGFLVVVWVFEDGKAILEEEGGLLKKLLAVFVAIKYDSCI